MTDEDALYIRVPAHFQLDYDYVIIGDQDPSYYRAVRVIHAKYKGDGVFHILSEDYASGPGENIYLQNRSSKETAKP